MTTTTANITFDNVMDLLYSLKSAYRKKASLQVGQPDMILNRPYHTSAYVPELAAGAKVMAFGDFSYYWIADRQGRSFKRRDRYQIAHLLEHGHARRNGDMGAAIPHIAPAQQRGAEELTEKIERGLSH